MKVFLSWSGGRSKSVASALREWLPDVMQWVEPWMSAKDIEAGARWSSEIEFGLKNCPFGVICLTQSNQNAPWILFEAGALAKTVSDSAFVCPLLVDIKSPALIAGPIAQFQAKMMDRSGLHELVRSINSASGEHGLNDEKLNRAFETWWPRLEEKFQALPAEAPANSQRSPNDMIEEILETTRSLSRMLQNDRLASALLGQQFGTIGESAVVYSSDARRNRNVLGVPTIRMRRDNQDGEDVPGKVDPSSDPAP